MKTAVTLVFLILIKLGFSQYAEEAKGVYYLTVSIKYGLKGGDVTQKVLVDVGEDKSHPLSGKVTKIEDERVAIGDLSEVKVFTNEVDLLHYLNILGWEIESVNTIFILATEYKQYLMKLEPEKE